MDVRAILLLTSYSVTHHRRVYSAQHAMTTLEKAESKNETKDVENGVDDMRAAVERAKMSSSKVSGQQEALERSSSSFSAVSAASNKTARTVQFQGNIFAKMTQTRRRFFPHSVEVRPTSFSVGNYGNGGNATQSNMAVPEIERIFDLAKYQNSHFNFDAFLDNVQLKQSQSVMLNLVTVLKSGWFRLGTEPMDVISKMMTITSLLGNSCNRVGQRMGEVIMLQVFTNIKEWVDRTTEQAEERQRLKEEKMKKQMKRSKGRGRRLMRLSSFVAARKINIEPEELLRLRSWLRTADMSVEALLMGQNDALDGFEDAVSYLGPEALSAIADVIQGTIMRAIIHFDFELATLKTIIEAGASVKGNMLTIFFSVVAILLSFMEVTSQLGLYGSTD